MFSEETSVFSVECYFAMFSDVAKTGSGSSRALSELVEFIFPLPYLVNNKLFFRPHVSGISLYGDNLAARSVWAVVRITK